MDNFCTYFDSRYLVQGLVLLDSLNQHCKVPFVLHVLCLDDKVFEYFQKEALGNVKALPLSTIEECYPDLLAAKANRTRIEYIFTLTPTWIKYLLESNPESSHIHYLDSDIMFFNSPDLILKEFGNGSVLIVPHFFSERNRSLEKYGKYNVGYIGIRNDGNGRSCVNWWKDRCIEWCFDRLEGDRFADQKYLDKWPELFENVVVSKNPGLNLAPYNFDNFQLTRNGSQVAVNGSPLVFVHYHKLQQVNRVLWLLNLFYTGSYRDSTVKYIYSRIIHRIVNYSEKIHSRTLLATRYSNSSRTKTIKTLLQNVVFVVISRYYFTIDLTSGTKFVRNMMGNLKRQFLPSGALF